MDETLFYLGVQTPVDDVIAVLHRVLPGGVRSDGTTAQWSGTYRNSGRNGEAVILTRFTDGQGNTASFLVERITEVTRVVAVLAPDDQGAVASDLRLRLREAFQDELVDSWDSMA